GVILRHPLFQRNVAEHSGLLLVVSAHETIIARNVPQGKAQEPFFNKFLVLLCYKSADTPEDNLRRQYCESEMSIVKAKIQTVEDMYRLIWSR
ncbi:MAG TPA: hypothetical protein VKE93_07975, partial [Candidatus Angelobacter sp.]|nr:hypothetical protein [Candidatus Angelobacter sp.]